MTRSTLLLVAISFLSNSINAQVLKQPAPDDLRAVEKVMEMQEKAWNSGDIESFMKGYWQSDQLVFVSGSGILHGWNATLAGYIERYPNRDHMGILTFEKKEVIQVDDRTIRFIGTFHLSRDMGDLSGYFTLIFRQIDGEWLIISDHTSAGN